jgi:hypothetical protein
MTEKNEDEVTLVIPGSLYRGLENREAFLNDNETDRASLKAFMAAEPRKYGGGTQYVITCPRIVGAEILGYIDGLAEMVAGRQMGVTASELETSLKVMRRVSSQPLVVKQRARLGAGVTAAGSDGR